jgi:phage terminase small subunit
MATTPASAGAARKAPAKQEGRKPEPKKLTDKQGAFALEYVRDLNATRAAIAAGFSAKTASVQGYQLLQNTLVREEIARLNAERVERLKMDADQLLIRLLEEAHADIADLFDDAGGLKPVSEWPMPWRRGLVGGLEIEEEYADEEEDEVELEGQPQGGALKRRRKKKRRVAVGRISKVKLSDRVKRLELIGKHTNVRAFDRSITVKPDVDALQEFAKLIQGRSIKPMGAK